MPDTGDKEFEEMISHPDFMSLSEPAQMQMVEEFKQKRRMITPKSENILSLAIKASSTPSGTLMEQTASLPFMDRAKVGFQTGQGLIGNLPENLMERPLQFAQGGIPRVQFASGASGAEGISNLIQSMRGGQQTNSFKPDINLDAIFSPSSQKGKIIAGIGNFATGAIPLVSPKSIEPVANAAGRGVESINPLALKGISEAKTKMPLDEELATQLLKGLQGEVAQNRGSRIGGIKDLIQKKVSSSQTETPKFKEPKVDKIELDRVLFGAKEEIPQKIKALEKEYSTKFGEGYAKISHSPSRAELASVYEKTLDQIDPAGQLRDVPGTPANQVKKLQETVIPVDPETGEPKVDVSELLHPNTVQGLHQKTMNILKNDNARVKYVRSLSDALSESSPELKKLKSEYAPKFKIVDDAKQYLTQSALGKVARGEASPERISKMRKSAGKIKSKSVESAEELFKRHTSELENLRNKYQMELEKQKQSLLSSEKTRTWGVRSKERLARYEQALNSQFSKELEDLKTSFMIDREKLNMEQIKRYSVLAGAAGILSALGVPKVRQFLKEKY